MNLIKKTEKDDISNIILLLDFKKGPTHYDGHKKILVLEDLLINGLTHSIMG